MSGSVNKVVLIGYLGNKPDIRTTQYGGKVASFSLATSESWTDKNSGERREKTEWHRIVIYNEALVKLAEQYLDRGSKIYLEGQLQTRKWQDSSGIDRYTTEIVLQNYRSTPPIVQPVHLLIPARPRAMPNKRARAGIPLMMTCHSNEHSSLLDNYYLNRI